MSKKISDIVLMSDVDGTLMDEYGAIPKRNVEAIERFTAAGGRFTIATGRALKIAKPLAKALPVNFPGVVYNGGAIYDFVRQEYLAQTFLPKDAGELFRKIWEVFPDCGVILATEDGYIDPEGVTRSKHEWWMKRYPETAIRTTKLSEIDSPAYKALLVQPAEGCRQLHEYVQKHAASFEGVRFVFSDITMFEMLPEGSSKGDAIEKLMALTGVERENIAAIGDYHNDIEMLELADISAAPSNAHADVKEVADLIVGPSYSGAVADLIEHLEERYGN